MAHPPASHPSLAGARRVAITACGAHPGLARALPPAHGPLRAARRHPARVPPPRRRPDLPPLRRALVLLRPWPIAGRGLGVPRPAGGMAQRSVQGIRPCSHHQGGDRQGLDAEGHREAPHPTGARARRREPPALLRHQCLPRGGGGRGGAVRGKPQAVPTVPTAKKRGGNTAGGQPQALRGFAKPVPTVPTKKVKDHSHIPAVSPAPPLLDSQNHQKMVGTVGTAPGRTQHLRGFGCSGCPLLTTGFTRLRPSVCRNRSGVGTVGGWEQPSAHCQN